MYKKLAIFSIAIIMLAITAVFTTPSGVTASSDGRFADPKPTPSKSKTRSVVFIDGEFDGVELVKTDAVWKKELSAKEFYVMREDGTEQPYTEVLTKNKKTGTYHCAACGLVLFKSDAKYDSETGWPSFFQVAFKKNVIEIEDRSLSEVRTEVECARCKAHLGHVFDDGPQPTGLRYCMNSISLKFRGAK